MSGKRILFFGYSAVGHACLKTLIDRRENIVAVFTHEDDAGETQWFPSVAKLAHEHGIPVHTESDFASLAVVEGIKALAPDLILSFYYRSMIPVNVLALAPLGAFNLHGSLLPGYRGRAPLNWAILNGETQTGVTLHVMVERADAGDIVDQEAVAIGADETAGEVQKRIPAAAVAVLNRQIENLTSGRAPRRVQDPSKVTYFGRRRPEDGEIRWDQAPLRIHNFVRALSEPFPGAFTEVNGKKLIVWAAGLARPMGRLKPGELRFEAGQLFAGCGDGGWIEIIRGQLDGGPTLSGRELGQQIFENAVDKEAGTQK